MRTSTGYRRIQLNLTIGPAGAVYTGKKLSLRPPSFAKDERPIKRIRTGAAVVRGARDLSAWNMSNIAFKRYSSERSASCRYARKSSLTHMIYGMYSSAELMSDRVTTETKRARFPVAQIDSSRDVLTAEYQRLVELEMTRGLSSSNSTRLCEVEAELDRLDSQEDAAVEALANYRGGIARLRELNQLTRRLKELL